MNAVQIIQNLCVKLRQLLVQTDDPVSLALAAFFLVRTAAAILALKIFLGSAVFIAPYRPAVNEMEFLSVRADWQTTFIDEGNLPLCMDHCDISRSCFLFHTW